MEEGRCFVRETDDLVYRLTIKFEVDLGLGAAVVPVGKRSELAPSEALPNERGAPDDDAHPRCLPGDAPFFGDGFGRGDDTARDQP